MVCLPCTHMGTSQPPFVLLCFRQIAVYQPWGTRVGSCFLGSKGHTLPIHLGVYNHTGKLIAPPPPPNYRKRVKGVEGTASLLSLLPISFAPVLQAPTSMPLLVCNLPPPPQLLNSHHLTNEILFQSHSPLLNATQWASNGSSIYEDRAN